MKSKYKIAVLYVFLPLMILSFALPAMDIIVNNHSEPENANFTMLASVGFIARSSTADYYDVHVGASDAFNVYNDFYGDGSTSYNLPISTYTATDSSATYSRVKSYLSYRDRVQITSHGSMTTSGPKVDLYGSIDLTPTTGGYWGVSSTAKCQLVYLAACDSMGEGGGSVDTRLAREIKDNSPVRMVIGFNGEAELFAATFLSMNFWYQHIAGLRVASSYGGYHAGAAFSRAEWMLESFIDDVEWTLGMAIAGVLGFAIAWLFGPLHAAILDGILHEIFSEGISEFLLGEWKSHLEDTMDAFIYLNDGEFVSSLTPVGGTGGGTGPKDVID